MKTLKMIVMVLALMVAGSVVAEESKEPFPDDPFPITKQQMEDMKPNSPEEAAFAAWVFRHCNDEPIKSSGGFGCVESAGVVAGPLQGGYIYKPKMGSKKGFKVAAFEAGLYQAKGEHKPNPLYAKLRCGSTIHDVTPWGPDPALGTTSIMEGESVTGWVAFEVPEGEDVASCTWSYDVPMKGRTRWLKVLMKAAKK